MDGWMEEKGTNVWLNECVVVTWYFKGVFVCYVRATLTTPIGFVYDFCTHEH